MRLFTLDVHGGITDEKIIDFLDRVSGQSLKLNAVVLNAVGRALQKNDTCFDHGPCSEGRGCLEEGCLGCPDISRTAIFPCDLLRLLQGPK